MGSLKRLREVCNGGAVIVVTRYKHRKAEVDKIIEEARAGLSSKEKSTFCTEIDGMVVLFTDKTLDEVVEGGL